MAKKSFKLKSGNTTPFKKMGSSPLKQDKVGTMDAVNKEITRIAKGGRVKADLMAQDKAVDKLATNKNISRKAFDTKLAEITKTVDPHPKSRRPTWDRSGGVKVGDHHKVTKGPEAMRPPKSAIVKKAVKKGVVKTIGKVVSRLAGPIGLGLLAGDVLGKGVKRVAKGIKTGKPQTKLKGKNIKDTFKRVKKKKYI